jgi:hypothetical protein
VKWSQCPDLATSFDIASNNHIGPALHSVPGGPVFFGDLVADDFRSDGRPVTDVHWWGSYIGNAIIPPAAFWIAFWSDLPGADPSQPAILLKSYVIPFPAAHEEFFGVQERFRDACADIPTPGDPDNTRCLAFQYFADISFDPFPDERDTVFWISIQAISSPTWGWKTGFPHFRDDAVLATGMCVAGVGGAPPCPVPLPLASPWPVPPGVLIKLVDPDTRVTVDMAFELTTVPEPSTLLLLASGLAGLVAWRWRRK